MVNTIIRKVAASAALIPLLAHAEPERPNIVLLYADDMGYGDLNIQNPASKIPTPHLDQLAREGLRLTDGHSPSGICTPSRYSLLTGRYHWRDVKGLAPVMGRQGTIPEGRLTLPEMLRQHGYSTAMVGKWHLGWAWDSIRTAKGNFPASFDWSKPVSGGPPDRGFDYYFGDDVINYPPYGWIENRTLVKAPDTMMDPSLWPEIKEGNWECRKGPMVTGWDPYENLPTLARKGVEYIHAQKGADRPFFLFFSFPSPHAPIIPNDAYDGKSDAGAYGDYVFQTDAICGQILKALEDIGQADNTLVIFTSDNGAEHYAYPREMRRGHWSSSPFRGIKRDLYEGGHRVPFLVRWPGVIAPGRVSDALISQMDIMATLAAHLGYRLPEDAAEDSCNQLPVWLGTASVARSNLVYNTLQDQDYAMRSGDWVLIDAESGNQNRTPQYGRWLERHGYPPDGGHPVELYNLAEDIEQRRNIAQEHPEQVANLQRLLQQIREQDPDAPRF